MRHLAMAIGLTEYFLGQTAPAAAEAATEAQARADRSDGDRLWGIARWARRVACPAEGGEGGTGARPRGVAQGKVR
ncbi:hypothetical protein ACFWY5_17480 [Nonomuraea sp. NPDC059007]|uniref:hypothetical protein n=1 Tax=Nonomuraea sp. NPDC059007 TaxID=3346692 RepID=UPI003677E11D